MKYRHLYEEGWHDSFLDSVSTYIGNSDRTFSVLFRYGEWTSSFIHSRNDCCLLMGIPKNPL